MLPLRQLLPAACAAVLAACGGDSPVAPPDRVASLSLRSSTAGDTITLADSVVLTASSADGERPRRVVWTVLPRGDSTVADTFVYHPAAPGEQVVRAVAAFDGGAVGSAARRVVAVARPANSAPVANITSVDDQYVLQTPVGDTIELVAAAFDPDGEALPGAGKRWYRRNGAGAFELFAIGDTLRIPVVSVQRYALRLRVSDAAGAEAIVEREFATFDPGRRARWRRMPAEVRYRGTAALAPNGTIVVAAGLRDNGSGACGTCGITALDPASGAALWHGPTDMRDGPAVVAPDGSVYGGTIATPTAQRMLVHLSPTGVREWTLAGAPLAQAMLSDGSLVSAADVPVANARVRRLRPDGTEVWTTPTLGLTRIISLAVGRGDTTYALGEYAVFGSSQPNRFVLLGLAPGGTILWQTDVMPRPSAGSSAPLALADDTTLLVTVNDSLSAFTTAGASPPVLRWRVAGGHKSPVVGHGAVFSMDLGTLRARWLADGAELWAATPVQPASTLMTSPLLTAGGEVIVGSNATVVAYDAITGAERWRHTLAGVMDLPPLLTDAGLLVLQDWSGFTEGVEVGSGPLASSWPMELANPRRTSRMRQ